LKLHDEEEKSLPIDLSLPESDEKQQEIDSRMINLELESMRQSPSPSLSFAFLRQKDFAGNPDELPFFDFKINVGKETRTDLKDTVDLPQVLIVSPDLLTELREAVTVELTALFERQAKIRSKFEPAKNLSASVFRLPKIEDALSLVKRSREESLSNLQNKSSGEEEAEGSIRLVLIDLSMEGCEDGAKLLNEC